MSEVQENSISTKVLCTQYNWYQNMFVDAIQQTFDEFFEKGFEIVLMGISANSNPLLKTEPCFVTKISIAKDYDVFFRFTSSAIKIILEKSLGKGNNKFDINNISELETKVITSFNSYIYRSIKEKMATPNPTELKRTNFDTINLTFALKDIDNTSICGRFSVVLPQELLSPEQIISEKEKFTPEDFPASETIAKVKVGTTKFSLYELKNLEVEDVVVFDNSNIDNLTITINGQDILCNIEPNMEILLSEDNKGDENMSENQNIWDSIAVDMNAEFEAVKISLGDLKNIESGLVVDLSSLYDSKVTLKVEGKNIASGSLVIVNDRYGVKVEEVYTDNQSAAAAASTPSAQAQSTVQNEQIQPEAVPQNNVEENTAAEGEEDFDYSDFELEDENI